MSQTTQSMRGAATAAGGGGGGAGGAKISAAAATELMVAVVIVAFVAFVLVFFLYLHSKRCRGAAPALLPARSRHRAAAAAAAPPPGGGLPAAAVKTLPCAPFRSSDFEQGLECSVCLSDVSDGEEVRLLPRCGHGFHAGCVDAWLLSHSTCPVCRTPVIADLSLPQASSDPPAAELAEPEPSDVASDDGQSPEPPIYPTNVLFWGSQDQISTGSVAAAVTGSSHAGCSMNCPNSATSPSTLISRADVEEMRLSTTSRLRSIRRLLSCASRGIGSTSSPRGGDIELGLGREEGGGLSFPKMPINS
uniref:RING-type domain-containing protein n=1 Tax=Ananas comosus var. bracteatus TaxID=296719 RepID=A0A6V7Q4X6_ANACO|nr:unnamed protein product [Ananas comosus var. bracteatus]